MPLETSLAGYWKFNGNGLDSSPNGRNFTLTGTMPYVSFLTGQGCTPTATNYWNIANPTWFDSKTTYSIQYWCYDVDYQLSEALLSYGTANAAECRVHYPFDTGSGNGFKIFDGAGFAFDLNNLKPALNSWQHVVMTVTPGSSKLYINGSQEATTATSLATVASQTNLRVGMYHNGAQGYSGNVAHLGIWTRELTQADVTRLYNNGSGNFYPFSEPELSSNSNALSIGLSF